MTQVVTALQQDPNLDIALPRVPSTYVSAANPSASSVQVTVPAKAVYAVIKATAAVYMAFGANPTAAAPTAADDGTANELISPYFPTLLKVDEVAKLAFYGTAEVTVTFYAM